MTIKKIFADECLVATVTLTHCFVDSIAIAWSDAQTMYRLFFLLFVLYKLHVNNRDTILRHLFTWLVWQAHGWFPMKNTNIISHIGFYITLSFAMFILTYKKAKLKYIAAFLIIICFFNDQQSRPGYYGTILNIIRTFLFWIEHLTNISKFHVQHTYCGDEAIQASTGQYLGSGIWILWTHPILLPLSFINTIHNIIEMWKIVGKYQE